MNREIAMIKDRFIDVALVPRSQHSRFALSGKQTDRQTFQVFETWKV